MTQEGGIDILVLCQNNNDGYKLLLAEKNILQIFIYLANCTEAFNTPAPCASVLMHVFLNYFFYYLYWSRSFLTIKIKMSYLHFAKFGNTALTCRNIISVFSLPAYCDRVRKMKTIVHYFIYNET